MCLPLIPALIAGSALLGAGVSLYTSSKSASVQKRGQDMAASQAEAQAKRAEQQQNKLNQKQPGLASIKANNKAVTSKGPGSTFLTGSAGVTNMMGSLGGRPSLLGG